MKRFAIPLVSYNKCRMYSGSIENEFQHTDEDASFDINATDLDDGLECCFSGGIGRIAFIDPRVNGKRYVIVVVPTLCCDIGT